MSILSRIYWHLASPIVDSINLRTQAQYERLEQRLATLQTRLDRNAFLSAAPLVNHVRNLRDIRDLYQAEFKVYSQGGEDGIIQYLVNHVPISRKVFVEFGVENYSECNTRFLLAHDNWEGLIMDADAELPQQLQSQELYWRYNLTALSTFITAENINDLITNTGIRGTIGLLSIDIDGNDYWVWKAINAVAPQIVICEYNSVFGSKHQITVPYKSDFIKTKHHYSNLCFGASLPAICRLAEEKGYDFVGCNSEGYNAFFVRKDVSAGLPKPTVADGYVRSKFRSSIDKNGSLTYLSGGARAEAIKDAEVFDLNTNRVIKIRDLGEL